MKVLNNTGYYLGVSLLSLFEEVGIEGFHCIQRCPDFRGLE